MVSKFMKGAKGMIILAVFFIVGYILFLIVRIPILPMTQIGPGTLPPVNITLKIWNITLSFLLSLFVWVIVIILVFYIIYKIIKLILKNTKSPIFAIICKIVLNLAPFPQFVKSGLFSLIDRLGGIIFSRATISGRVVKFVKAIGYFVYDASAFELEIAKSGVQEIVNANANNKTATESQSSPFFTKSDESLVQNQYNQCIEENIIDISPDLSGVDRTTAIVKNGSTRTICKAKQLQSYLDIISYRL